MSAQFCRANCGQRGSDGVRGLFRLGGSSIHRGYYSTLHPHYNSSRASPKTIPNFSRWEEGREGLTERVTRPTVGCSAVFSPPRAPPSIATSVQNDGSHLYLNKYISWHSGFILESLHRVMITLNRRLVANVLHFLDSCFHGDNHL